MLIVIPAWALSEKHGGIRVLCEMASGLHGRGHRVLFLAFDEDSQPSFPTSAEVVKIGPLPWGRNLIGDLPRQWKLRGALERFPEADVVLANHNLTALPVHAARIAARKVYYIQAYEADFYPRTPQRILYRWRARRTYEYPLHHVANAPSVARAAHGEGFERVPIVPPGLDPALYHSRGRRPPGGRLRVGTIGRFGPWKGTVDCFEAVRRVRARGLDLEFSLAFGNVPAGYERDPRVDVAPRNDGELTDWYRSLDILISAIYWGGAPYPPLEAMACGTAVVSTPNDHVRADQTALVVPQQDPEGLADALARMMADAALRERLVANGRIAAEAHHWERVVATMEGVLSGRIEAPRGRRKSRGR